MFRRIGHPRLYLQLSPLPRFYVDHGRKLFSGGRMVSDFNSGSGEYIKLLIRVQDK